MSTQFDFKIVVILGMCTFIILAQIIAKLCALRVMS